MRSLVQGCICILLLHQAFGQVQNQFATAVSSAFIGGVSATSNLVENITYEDVLASPTITTFWIVNPSDIFNTPAECKFAYSSGLLAINIEVLASLPTKKIAVNGVETNCYFQNTPASTTYVFNFLSAVDPPNTNSRDVLFTETVSPSNVGLTNRGISGTQAFPPFPLTNIVAVDYNPVLQIFAAGGSSPTTLLQLGDAAFLRVTMTITNYARFLDYAGARVTNCKMSQTSDFAVSTIIIDSNGCFTPATQLNNNQGFSRTTAPTVGAASSQFVAQTPNFPVFNHVITNVNGNQRLYFMCDISYCDDATITTAGECGGNHCSNAKRKKRDTRFIRSVTTSVRIAGGQERKEGQCDASCDMSVGYKAAVGGLSGLAIILLGGMIVSYKSVMNVYEERKERASSRDVTSQSTRSWKSETRSKPTHASVYDKPVSVMSSRISGSKKRAF